MSIATQTGMPQTSPARPTSGVLSLNIRDKNTLYAAYMPYIKGGGLFVPSHRPHQLGEEIFMLISLLDDPNKISIQGKVVWIAPEGVQGSKVPGIGVQFHPDENGIAIRAKIENHLAGMSAPS